MRQSLSEAEPVLVGESASIRSLRDAVRAVAATRATVLVTGETGTGKGLVARRLHAQGGRGPFVHVDCASLSPNVVESELFGHERGAFTGAVARRRGRLEAAGEGTVFLDEISEVDASLQAKLLRVLQDRRFERVGGGRTLPFPARVVAATNRDLAQEIAAGRFRADLYYRLQVVELRIPPLRERPGDVARLFAWAAARSSLGREPRVTRAFRLRLDAHPWPGNVRELMNLVEGLVASRTPEPWCAHLLEDRLACEAGVAPGPGGMAAPASRAGFEERERAELTRMLACHRWNVSATARALGWSRGALRGRMARLGIG